MFLQRMAEISDHEMMRRGLWVEAYIAILGAEHSSDLGDPSAYARSCADEALEDFDKRFPKPEGFET